MAITSRLPPHPFEGRSIQLVRDLSVDEQLYLYDKTRILKQAVRSGRAGDEFRLDDPELGLYLMFLEDSTRTKESFRNAAKFHNLKLNDFQASSSSFANKKESITDTVKMLFGYSRRSIFVIRSRLEGLCRWLETAVGEYASRLGMSRPSFINAGDGRHEHPTQEFLDQFSFLEQLSWDRGGIHLALVGDLFHGRTVHSKVDGLGIYGEVRVDLVSPPELSMPPHYLELMKMRGYEIRVFESIDAYLDAGSVAPIWYFTRLQLERMGERLLDRAHAFRRSVTFRPDMLSRLPEGVRFYHPLPRHRVTPTIPPFLDRTPLNGWDEQSMNGYFTRVIEVAMLSGKVGRDFEGETVRAPSYHEEFVHSATIRPKRKPESKVGIKPVENGIVIDHIGKGSESSDIWDHISSIRRVLGWTGISSQGVFRSHDDQRFKGIISLPETAEFDRAQLKMLAAIAPGATVNMIRESSVVSKYRLSVPPRVYDLPGLTCKNEECVSHESHHEPVVSEFIRRDEDSFVCHYCERPHRFGDIW